MSTEFDRRKKWFDLTTTEDFIKNKPAIEYIYMCETINLLKEILKELKKENK